MEGRMRAGFVLATTLLIVQLALQAAPQRARLDGQQAFTLISLLASGNDRIWSALNERSETHIVVRDLQLLEGSTYKHDPTDAAYKLALYWAHGTIGNDSEASPFGEATALWTLFRGLKFPMDGSMQGATITVAIVDCTIDPKSPMTSVRRFRCDVTADR
jgi:hypothetical protein